MQNKMEIIQEHACVWKYWLSEERLVQTSVGMFQRHTFKIHTSVGANLSWHVSMRHFQNSHLHELKVTIAWGSFH